MNLRTGNPPYLSLPKNAVALAVIQGTVSEWEHNIYVTLAQKAEVDKQETR